MDWKISVPFLPVTLFGLSTLFDGGKRSSLSLWIGPWGVGLAMTTTTSSDASAARVEFGIHFSIAG